MRNAIQAVLAGLSGGLEGRAMQRTREDELRRLDEERLYQRQRDSAASERQALQDAVALAEKGYVEQGDRAETVKRATPALQSAMFNAVSSIKGGPMVAPVNPQALQAAAGQFGTAVSTVRVGGKTLERAQTPMQERMMLMEQERGAKREMDREEREARKAAQEAALEQQAELARERMASDAQRNKDANDLRRELASIAAGNRADASRGKADARAEQISMRLRSQYEANPTVKDAYTISGQLESVKAAAQDPTAAGDLAMIFSYMKILDPNSVVRETEFATAQNSAGVPDRIRNVYNRAKEGTRLTPAQRMDFLNQAQKRANEARTILTKQNNRYAKIAKDMGVDPSLVVYDPFAESEAASPTVSTGTRPPLTSFVRKP